MFIGPIKLCFPSLIRCFSSDVLPWTLESHHHHQLLFLAYATLVHLTLTLTGCASCPKCLGIPLHVSAHGSASSLCAFQWNNSPPYGTSSWAAHCWERQVSSSRRVMLPPPRHGWKEDKRLIGFLSVGLVERRRGWFTEGASALFYR